MSDPKPNRASIPDWQKPNATASNDPDSNSTPSPASDENETSAPRSALLEQATKFLQDDSIRDASIDRKISFLESKGLQNNEIDSLLGVSRNSEATNTSAESASPDSVNASPKTENEPETQASSPPSTSSSSSPPATTSSSVPNTARSTTSSSPRDVPPIITYPEFLVHQSKPPPLVSLQSILYTLYGAAGIGASIYGASEYLVKPMLANLTSARHDLAQTASENLQKLNDKLEQNVSVIPPQLTARKANDESSEDSESITSDPTELFHRDVATQTSDLEQAQSKSKEDGEAVPDPTATVNTHVKRIEILKSHLREFADTEKQSSSVDDSARTGLNELHHYLDGLIYSKPGYGPVTGYGVYSSPGMDSSGTATGVGKGEEDAISSFKSEIRGVKGALLSARNFPSRGRVGTSLSLGR
ncbi:putative peroxisomal membrane anchor protein [Aspergillus steynii IBT 23096]|uniref:Peroxisomal membrane protein PEX14 n=1 Tax=Aspergillus steynii IBT 23096 TaxID=1392250 RepID=A0A2I2GS63_9EURO|nr:putative peroxisomal membrane anchor protein [Aspergillus steynii IBT 23096]PLB55717.1 putative peroxisomal membrane anchor protein [Aspergillus steynii IBT 23096]